MLCVRAELISTRLLDDHDKCDMLNGELPIEALAAHIELWRDNGMPDYANGRDTLFVEDHKRHSKPKNVVSNAIKSSKFTLRKPFR